MHQWAINRHAYILLCYLAWGFMPSAIYANMGLFGGFVGFGVCFLGLGSLVAVFVILNTMTAFFYRFTDRQDYKPPAMSGRRAGGPYIWAWDYYNGKTISRQPISSWTFDLCEGSVWECPIVKTIYPQPVSDTGRIRGQPVQFLHHFTFCTGVKITPSVKIK